MISSSADGDPVNKSSLLFHLPSLSFVSKSHHSQSRSTSTSSIATETMQTDRLNIAVAGLGRMVSMENLIEETSADDGRGSATFKPSSIECLAPK